MLMSVLTRPLLPDLSIRVSFSASASSSSSSSSLSFYIGEIPYDKPEYSHMTLEEFVSELEGGLRPALPAEIMPVESSDHIANAQKFMDSDNILEKDDYPPRPKDVPPAVPTVSLHDFKWLHTLLQGGWQFHEADRLTSAQLASTLEEYCRM